jgi:hypothetical protein
MRSGSPISLPFPTPLLVRTPPPPHCWVITPLSCAITRALTGGGWPDAYADEDNDDEDEANKPSDLEVQCLDAFLRCRPYVRYPPLHPLFFF